MDSSSSTCLNAGAKVNTQHNTPHSTRPTDPPLLSLLLLLLLGGAENYNESAYFREALRLGEAKPKGLKREWKAPQHLDFQFVDPRLEALEKKEFQAEQRLRDAKQKRDEERKEKRRQEKERAREEKERMREERRLKLVQKNKEGGADGAAEDGSEEEAADDLSSRASPSPSPQPASDGVGGSGGTEVRKGRGRPKKVKEEETEEGGEEDGEEDDAELRAEAGGLTEKEEALKAELEAAGFGDWQRKHFNGYIRAVERFGRHADRDIADSGLVDGKTPKEVRAYHAAFMRHYRSIAGWEQLMARIEKGETRRERLQSIQQLIDNKVRRHRRPLDTLTLAYPTAQRMYTPEEDRFLLCGLSKLGWGAWDELKAEIRLHFMFRFDWFLKSRSSLELQKRAEYLCKLLQKDKEVEDEKKKHQASKKASAASKSAAAKRKADAASAAKSGSKKAKR